LTGSWLPGVNRWGPFVERDETRSRIKARSRPADRATDEGRFDKAAGHRVPGGLSELFFQAAFKANAGGRTEKFFATEERTAQTTKTMGLLTKDHVRGGRGNLDFLKIGSLTRNGNPKVGANRNGKRLPSLKFTQQRRREKWNSLNCRKAGLKGPTLRNGKRGERLSGKPEGK